MCGEKVWVKMIAGEYECTGCHVEWLYLSMLNTVRQLLNTVLACDKHLPGTVISPNRCSKQSIMKIKNIPFLGLSRVYDVLSWSRSVSKGATP